MADVECYKTYEIKNNVLTRIVEKDMDMDIDVTLFYEAKISLKPAPAAEETPVISDLLAEEEFQKIVSDTILMAYMGKYMDGLDLSIFESGTPEEDLLAEIKTRIDNRLSVFHGMAADSFIIEKYWISESDKEMLKALKQMTELRDPKKAAAFLQQQTQAVIEKGQWICPCGNINNSNFCPKCGRPKASGKTLA